MSATYKAVQWTPAKIGYDAVTAFGVLGFVASYIAAAVVASPNAHPSEIQLAMRALGAAAFVLFTVILLIGPAARLSRRFLPLLYNRRHLGVTCFAVAATHAALSIVWYHGFAQIDPLVSLLTANPRFDSITGFPFELLGVGALAILFLMAATSHDFWNALLGPRLWKALHMAAYPAYALIVAHGLLGVTQSEPSPLHATAFGAGAAIVAAAHLAAGLRERARDRIIAATTADGWLHVGAPELIPDKRAKIVDTGAGARIAVFREGARITAISNRCRHQGGPLGEGRIVDGCVTCPWHGFQYRPEDGVSPPPYRERVATYPTKIVGGEVFVHPHPAPLGAVTAPSFAGRS